MKYRQEYYIILEHHNSKMDEILGDSLPSVAKTSIALNIADEQ